MSRLSTVVDPWRRPVTAIPAIIWLHFHPPDHVVFEDKKGISINVVITAGNYGRIKGTRQQDFHPAYNKPIEGGKKPIRFRGRAAVAGRQWQGLMEAVAGRQWQAHSVRRTESISTSYKG